MHGQPRHVAGVDQDQRQGPTDPFVSLPWFTQVLQRKSIAHKEGLETTSLLELEVTPSQNVFYPFLISTYCWTKATLPAEIVLKHTDSY